MDTSNSKTFGVITGISRKEWDRRDQVLRDSDLTNLSDDELKSLLAEREELQTQLPIPVGSATIDAVLFEPEPTTDQEIRESWQRRRLGNEKRLKAARDEARRREDATRLWEPIRDRSVKEVRDSVLRARSSSKLKDAIRQAKREIPDASQKEIAEAADRILDRKGILFKDVCPKRWLGKKSLLGAFNDHRRHRNVKRYISGVK